MALLAKTSNTIETKGSISPIPFFDNATSPDKVIELKISNPNKIKFNIMFNLPKTN
jgi:hypothetical protein